MGKRAENKEVRTNKMIQGAIEAFESNSIEATKMTDIAKAAGIGVASLYRYFKTKGDIAVEVGIQFWETANEEMIRVVDSKKTGYEKIEAFLRIYQGQSSDQIRFFKLVEQLDHYIAKMESKPNRMVDYEKAVLKSQPKILSFFELGKADGSIHKSIDAKRSLAMFNHTLTALKQKHVSRGLIISTDSADEQEAEISLLIEVFLRYLQNGL